MCTTERLQTVIHLAVSQNSLRVLQFFAAEKSLSVVVNCQNKWGETALHLASGLGNPEIVTLLLRMGADESTRDKWERTAGDVAIENGYCDRVFSGSMLNRIFVSLPKESVDRLDRPKQPAVNAELLGAVLARKPKVGLESQTTSDSLEVVTKPSTFKVRHMFGDSTETLTGVTVSSSDFSPKLPSVAPTAAAAAPLRRVALSKLIEYPGDPLQMRSLLASGAVDLNGRDMFGLSALHKAAAWDKVDLLDLLLLTVSESESVDVNALTNNQDGFSALHMCVDSGAIAAARRLLEDPRVVVDLTDRKGRTPLTLAIELGNCLLVEMLSAER
jgi:hypothetical protein